ncbi:MAG: hypothetical protein K2X66_04435 [Cyanobacteria bacterium]|nr:hypothetical protein [Cyanobacteriota bacterium]
MANDPFSADPFDPLEPRPTLPLDLILRLQRLYRLSEKPQDAAHAYRQLEHIHLVCERILTEFTDTNLEALLKKNKANEVVINRSHLYS